MPHPLEGFDRESYDREYTDRQIFRRLAAYLRPQRRFIVVATLAAIGGSLTGTAFPIVISRGIDALGTSVTFGRAAVLIVAIALTGSATWGFTCLRQWYAARVVGDTIFALRRDAYHAVIGQDMTFFDEHPSGGVVSRLSADTESFSALVQIVLDLMGQSLLILAVMVVLFVINALLALVTVVLALLIVTVTLAFRRLARRASRAQQRALAQLNAHLQESLGGITVAKNFRQEQAIYADLTRANNRWYAATRRVNVLFSGIFPFMLTVTGFGTVAVLYFGGRMVHGHLLSPGEWYLFLQSVALFWIPLTNLASFWGQFQRGLSAGERVLALIDAQPAVRQTGNESLRNPGGAIELRHVTFRYGNHEAVLEDFDLTIGAGEVVALVGHTGAGKSSIARLIRRSYEFQRGQILVGGQDIRRLDLEGYQRQLGVVPQVPFLISGTVADNIRYPRPDASDEEVAAAAHRVGGGDWLDLLTAGLATPVGELGKNLSMGQRQLVALARVFLQNPAILILDEATASIDPLTEAQIQEGLDAVTKGRTAIIIAHRLSTIRRADRIIVLEGGKIIEQGSHDVLLRANGYYRAVYEQYFRFQSLEWDIAEQDAVARHA